MRETHLVGRIILALFYLFNGLHHFVALGPLSGYAATRGVPLPTLAVLVAGCLLLIAGLSFLFGIAPRVGVAAAVLFFVPVTLFMHAFWADTDPTARMMDVTNFQKNFALLGSSLVFLAIPEPWPYAVRFHRKEMGRREHVPA